jgi:ankyrin repeat protein
MMAAHAGHREVVETLIAHRAKLNINSKFGLSSLMFAVIAGHAEVARLLAKAGADLTAGNLDSLTRLPMILLWSAACWGCPRN